MSIADYTGPRPTPTQNRLKKAGTAPLSAAKRRGQRIDSVGQLWKSGLVRSYSGEASPSDAIDAKCRDCVCYENVVDEIRNCTSYTCPLWAYRPYADKTP